MAIIWETEYRHHLSRSLELFAWARDIGICAEQARLVLPMYGLYTVWTWTASLQAVAHFLYQRLDRGAQAEIRAYAEAVHGLVAGVLPHALDAVLPPETPRPGGGHA